MLYGGGNEDLYLLILDKIMVAPHSGSHINIAHF